jgi:DNA adenine methylase
MKNPRAYDTYFGGKNGNGTYQTIINHIPPHDVYASLFLGNCGVTSHIKLAENVLLTDIDMEVITAWKPIMEDKITHRLKCNDAFYTLKLLEEEKKVYPEIEYFIYLDPPYRLTSRKNQRPVYRYEMTDQQHVDLLSQITAMSDHKIMVSHYPDPMYDEALKDWHTHDFLSTTRNGMAWERLYMNYDLSDGLLHDYSYIGADYREREALARQKRNVMKKIDRLPTQLKESLLTEIFEKYKVNGK